jgi:putative membrane protein
MTALKAKKGADFDRAYIADQVKGHREAVRLFSRAAKNAKDAEVKSYAEKTLPTLKHHLEMAESLQQSMRPSRPMSKSKKEPVKGTDTSS